MAGYVGYGTPEQIEARRQELAALLAANANPQTVGAGIGALGAGLVAGIDRYRLRQTERQGTEQAQNAFSSLFNGSAAPGTATPAPSPSQVAAGNPSLGGVPVGPAPDLPKGETASYIKEGLVKRGVPEHVAEGVILNFQDESGLNPGINEIAPTVKGSRGGFGLAQWTGPRRVALEQYAASIGKPPSDIDTQLDFFMQENQGAEKGAWQKVLSAENAGEAAANFVSHWERPAEKHKRSRVAKYLAYGGTPAADPAVASAGDAVNAMASGAPIPTAPGSAPPVDVVAANSFAPTEAGINNPNNRQTIARLLGNTVLGGAASPTQTAAPADVASQAVPTDLPEMAGRQPIQPSAYAEAGFPPAPAPYSPQQPPAQPSGPSTEQLMQIAANPWLSGSQRQVVEAMLGQRQRQDEMQARQAVQKEEFILRQQAESADPLRQIQLQKAQIELEQLRNPQSKPNLINAGDGRLYNASTGEWVIAPDANGEPPKLVELYDEKTGLPYKARFDSRTGQYERVGGVKAPNNTTTSIDPATGQVVITQGQGGGGSGLPKLTESEGKNAGFYTRALDAEKSIQSTSGEGGSLWNKVFDNVPVLGNYAKGDGAQKFGQAKRDFVNAVLRRESGAVISDEEFANADIQYFPQPGDSQAVIEQKANNRKNAIESMKLGAGGGGAFVDRQRAAQEGWNTLPSGVKIRKKQ